MAAYLRPTAPIAAAALLPDDPALALALAQATLEKPVMANHSYGLWGYHGHDRDGRELTVQATGIGAGGAAAVLSELADRGVSRAVRVGSCTAIAPELAAGELVRVTACLPGDGVSRALAARNPHPDAELDLELAAAVPAARPVTVAGYDLGLVLAAADARAQWRAAGAAVADLQSAALLALGERRGVAVAAALAVAETEAGTEADDEALTTALLELGSGAARALADLDRSFPFDCTPR